MYIYTYTYPVISPPTHIHFLSRHSSTPMVDTQRGMEFFHQVVLILLWTSLIELLYYIDVFGTKTHTLAVFILSSCMFLIFKPLSQPGKRCASS